MAEVKETRELVDFVVGLFNALGKSLEDGKVGFSDLFLFVEALQKAGPAFADVSKVAGELSDLDEAEYQELLAHVQKTFDIELDEIEEKVELAFEIGLKIAQVWSRWVGASKPVPTPAEA